MAATQSETLAEMERLLAADPSTAADVLMHRARELASYHATLLKVARPLIRELIVEFAAMLQAATDEETLDLGTLLGAVAMALDEPRLTTTLAARIARSRATVSITAVRQAAASEAMAEIAAEGRA